MVEDKELRVYKKKTLVNLKPDSIIALKKDNETQVELYVTDINGLPYSVKNLSLSNTDGNIIVSNTLTGLQINISSQLLTIINSSLQSGDNISELTNDSGYISYLEKESGENIPSHTPVAIINNLAYKLSNLNPQHQFAFVGFSVNGTTQGQICKIQQIGELTLNGWGLTENTQYLAGNAGSIQTENLSNGFTKVVGYATTSNTLQIIKDYSTINR